MGDYTPYQKKVIERYYDHRDEIMLSRLQEVVTDLCLAESDRKKDALWKKAATAMKSLEVPPATVEHILKERNPEMLAKNVRMWLETPNKAKAGGAKKKR